MARDLNRLLAPRSIAVVGGGAWCANVIRSAQAFGHQGPIWPVHPTRDTVSGLTAYPSVAELPEAPDAAFVGVNHAATIEVITELSKRGAGGAVAFASGFGEVEDAEAADRQAHLVAAAGNMPVIGPNCYGYVNALDRAALWPDVHGLVPVEKGVAIVTQSSNIAINLTMQRRGLPIAAVITAGNQAQMGLADLGAALIADPRITALGLHIEGVGDLRAFEHLAQEAARAGKPVVVIKAGRSEAARAATVSHTASLAGSSAGASALLKRLGCAEVETLGAFLETLKAAHVLGALPGTALASMSCSGGEASLIADAATRVPGLTWTPLTDAQRGGLHAVLGDRVTLANPLDYHTYIWNDVERMAQAFAAMMEGPQDITLLVADFPRADRSDPADWQCLIHAARAARQQTGKRLALIASLPDTMPEDVVADLAQNGILCLSGLDDGLRALAHLAEVGEVADTPLLLPPPDLTHLLLVDEDAAKDVLARFGINVPQRRRAASPPEAGQVAQDLAAPLVLKGLGMVHKSDTGGVVLGLSADQVEPRAAQMQAEAFLIEEQITGTLVELLIGVVRDPAHGFVLTLGAGGTETELRRDTQSLLVPSPRDAVDAALDRLALAPVLRGWRGRPPVARTALLDTVMAVQEMVVAHAATLDEVEINPLIVTATRAVAVDAVLRLGDRPDE